MKATIFIVLLLALGSQARLKTVEELRDSITAVSSNGTVTRAYSATWYPSVDPRVIQLRGIAVDKTTDSTATVDAVEFDLSTFLQTGLAFGYFHAEANLPTLNNFNLTQVTSASAFAFFLRAFAPFEYNEVNGVAGFQNGSDIITGIYDLSHFALQWKPLIINQTSITATDGTTNNVFYITAETQDEVFYLRFIVSGTPVQVGGVVITPDSCKVDFAVRWFQPNHVTALWTTGPSSASVVPNARVGLLTGLAAVAETVNAVPSGGGSGGNQPAVSFETSGYTGFFSWAPNADVTVSGVEAAQVVNADILDVSADPQYQGSFTAGAIVKVAFFSFEGIRPSEVAWDPEFGTKVDYPDSGSSSDAVTQSVAFALFVVAFLMI